MRQTTLDFRNDANKVIDIKPALIMMGGFSAAMTGVTSPRRTRPSSVAPSQPRS